MTNQAPKNKQKGIEAYAKYSAMGLQMGISIYLGAIGGQFLDEHFGFTYLFTIVGSLLGVVLALYFFITSVLDEKK